MTQMTHQKGDLYKGPNSLTLLTWLESHLLQLLKVRPMPHDTDDTPNGDLYKRSKSLTLLTWLESVHAKIKTRSFD